MKLSLVKYLYINEEKGQTTRWEIAINLTVEAYGLFKNDKLVGQGGFYGQPTSEVAETILKDYYGPLNDETC